MSPLKNIRLILIPVLLVTALVATGQDKRELKENSPWRFGLNYAIGIETFLSADTINQSVFRVPAEEEYGDHRVFYTEWLFHTINGSIEYKPLTFLTTELGLFYTYGGYSKNLTSENAFRKTYTSLQIRDLGIQPALNFDVLYLNKSKALTIGAGMSIFHRNQETGYWTESSVQDQQKLYREVDREGWGNNYFLSLGWEDYRMGNWGYFVKFKFVAPYRFNPSSAVVSEYQIDGQEVNLKGEEFTYSNNPSSSNSLSSESFLMKAIYLSVGVKYRL